MELSKAKELVKRHIETLETYESPMIPYGGGNPYSYCADCGNSVIEGHDDNCLGNKNSTLVEALKLLTKDCV